MRKAAPPITSTIRGWRRPARNGHGAPVYLEHRWREYDTATPRTPWFYALRLHDAGMIKSSPNTIISEGTDWRFVNELKREPKA